MIKYIYTSIFIYFCSNTIGQTLSFSDALEKMYSENQKLKGFEKQKQASHYEEKSYIRIVLPRNLCKWKLYSFERPSIP